MSSVRIYGDSSGSITLSAPTSGTDVTITLPSTTGTIALTSNSSFTGQTSFASGASASPSLTFTGDTNTGLWSPAADTIAASTGGTERMRITSAGNVGIGTSSPGARLDIAANDSNANVLVTRSQDSAAQPGLILRKSRGTNAAPTVVSANDILGIITGQGYDGSAYQSAAAIQLIVDATPGASDMPGRLSFQTTADGSTTLTERMRINNAGLITGSGTSLGAWTAYTPTLGGTGWAIGNGTVDAAYCQIGKLVAFRIDIVFGSTSTYGAGAPTISAPITGKSGKATVHQTGLYFDASTSQQFPASIQHLESTFFPRTLAAPTAAVTSAVPFTWATSDIIRFHGIYEAA